MKRIAIAITLLLATAATTAAANETEEELYGLSKPAAELRLDESVLPDSLTVTSILRASDGLEAEAATDFAEYVPLPYDD